MSSFVSAVRNFIETSIERVAQLVHPDVLKVMGAINHQVIDLIEELEDRVSALESYVKASVTAPPVVEQQSDPEAVTDPNAPKV